MATFNNNKKTEIVPEQQTQDSHIRSSPGDVEIPTRIFVKGFCKDTSEEELKSFFKIYGIVHDATIVRDKLGVSKGFAFITFDSQEIAEKMKDMGHVLYKDREVVIGTAKYRKKRPMFRFRPREQFGYWHHGMPPQPTYFVSPDGVWYQAFQQPVPVMTSPMQYQVEVILTLFHLVDSYFVQLSELSS